MKIKSKRHFVPPQLRTLQAHRLACADFLYGMNPDDTAVICRLQPSQAKSLRKSKPYKGQMENLKLEHLVNLKRKMEKSAEEINEGVKQRMAQLVPAAIERLADQLQDEGLVGLQASREILDRDGRFPKVSRVQSTIEDKRTMPDASDSLLQEFGQVPKAVN